MDFSALIKAIHVRSNYGPDIDLVDPLAPGPPNPLMQKLQPMIVIDTDAGPITLNPYGKPGPTQWDNLTQMGGIVGALVFGLAGYGLYRLVAGAI